MTFFLDLNNDTKYKIKHFIISLFLLFLVYIFFNFILKDTVVFTPFEMSIVPYIGRFGSIFVFTSYMQHILTLNKKENIVWLNHITFISLLVWLTLIYHAGSIDIPSHFGHF